MAGSRGKALVEGNCARCHATGKTGNSTHPDAPPFRILSQRYPLDSLEEALAEGISTGHPDMPEFVATPDQISAIIDYIGSLQKP
jgi:cytochrome c